jgi:hypothetical protein
MAAGTVLSISSLMDETPIASSISRTSSGRGPMCRDEKEVDIRMDLYKLKGGQI